MSIFSSIKKWLELRRPRKLDELLAIEFDDEEVRIRVLERLEPGWNQSFRWGDVKRVCFKDEGLYSSDIVIIAVYGRENNIVIPTEARGGSDFFGAICDRGLLPENVWRKAMGDTSGGTHCWLSLIHI